MILSIALLFAVFGCVAAFLSSVRIVISTAILTIPLFIILAAVSDFSLGDMLLMWLTALLCLQLGYFAALLLMVARAKARNQAGGGEITPSAKTPGLSAPKPPISELKNSTPPG